MAQRDRFTIGSFRTECHVYEGDGTRPILEENVQILYEPGKRRVDLPDEVQRWRDEIEEEEAQKQAAGLPYRWNNPRFAVERLTVARTHEQEEPVIQLSLCDADYYDFLATSLNLDRPLREGDDMTLRKQYLENADPTTAPAFLSCSFGVNIAVETGKDGKMVFARRSDQCAGRNNGRWNSSANEGLARIHDVPKDGSPISLHAVARRALKEEMAIQASDHVDLELLAFALDLLNNQWAAFFRAVLPQLTEEDLRRRREKGVEDKWEHDHYEFVPADPDSVIEFILSQPEDSWTPCGPALFYLATVRRTVVARGGDPAARLEVEEAERRVEKRLRRTKK